MTSTEYAINAHAKVNLRLKVTGRRDDGYHVLSMLNLLIDLADRVDAIIDLGCARRVSIEVIGGRGEGWERDPHKNLAARAAQIFLEEHSIDASIKIALTKRIPVGAGLGGGSADAAAVLRLLAAVFAAPASATNKHRSIEQLALDLGADVPFLLDGRIAIVRGIGEKISPLQLDWIYGLPLLLIVPPFTLSTAQVFATYKNLSTSDASTQPQDSTLTAFSNSQLHYSKLLELLDNDLEQAACDCAPALTQLLGEARKIKSCATVMSGSGSAFVLLPRVLGDTATLYFAAARKIFEQFGCRVFASSFVAPQKVVLAQGSPALKSSD